MESIHGVDVSWLHRPANSTQQSTASNPRVNQLPKSTDEDRTTKADDGKDAAGAKAQDTSETSQPPSKGSRRPHLLGRSTSEKPTQAPTNPNEAKSPPKRSSWMSSLTSKLSNKELKSQNGKAASPATLQTGSDQASLSSKSYAPPITPKKEASTGEEAVEEGSAAYEPTSPRFGNPSFLSNALRRISSSTLPQAQAGALGDRPQCDRCILNRDEGRPRVEIDGLNQAKLRRVSFSVDVEIAGSSRYPVEGEDESLDSLDKKHKKKDKKLKERGEGAALKNTDAVTREKEAEGVIHASGEKVGKDAGSVGEKQAAPMPVTQSTTASTDSIPPPAYGSRLSNSDESQPQGSADANQPPTKPQDRPTTDPLRIYRRCCQLRESPVLKRISEQLGNSNNVGVEGPGVVSCLNLNKSRLQLPDVVCLGDWLAVVPVKKLLFDEANLTDEGVRVVLAGLLAARLPEAHKRKRGRSTTARPGHCAINRSPGVIEKLTLKGNTKLTAEAWRHICLFLNLCKSIKAVDLSMIPFPQTPSKPTIDSGEPIKASYDIAELLHVSLAKRLGGDMLQELTFGECGLNDYHVSKIAAAATEVRLSRLGLAGNNLTSEGLKHVAAYLRASVCMGLDLGGIDLRGKLPVILDPIDSREPLQAISVADCNLQPQDLTVLFEKLLTLSDFRFIDLSHNKSLFSERQSALGLLRKYLPRFHLLKRLHLMDVNMSPADAIGIAEIVPEIRNLAHLNVLNNPQLQAVAMATDSATSEEACALYASMMTAVRLSKTVVAVDIEVPGPKASEVVRALARQVIAYCLRNMELLTQGNAVLVADAAAALPDVSEADPDVLRDIGHSDTGADMSNLPPSAKNEDYLVGGQGWIKALNHCLNASDLRRMSVDTGSTPSQVIESEAGKAQAKEMSKDLLASARNFRRRLEAVLLREEAGNADQDVLKRLQFLDHAILSIIERFEREFPETRLSSHKPSPSTTTTATNAEQPETIEPVDPLQGPAYTPFYTTDNPPSEAHNSFPGHLAPSSSDDGFGQQHRRPSATDLHSRALAAEEGTAHRFGQRLRREVLPPKGTEDRLHGTTIDQQEPGYAQELRRRLEALGGEEIQERLRKEGWESVVESYGREMEGLRRESLPGGGGGEGGLPIREGPAPLPGRRE